MLLGGHWLTEKFQFLSTLAWQSGDDEGAILGELDLVVPLYGNRNATGIDQSGWFLQPGLVSWEADNGDRRLDVNIGLAHRRLIRDRIAIGAAVFYDHNIDSDLKRIGGGLDLVSPSTYVAVNYYHPLNSWRTGERLGFEERALRGVDVNLEQALLDTGWVVEASGGFWKGYDVDNREGEWHPAGSVGVRYYPLHYLSVYADYAYQHEDVDTDRFAAGIEFSYPGRSRNLQQNEVDLWRPVKREKQILYAERRKIERQIGTPTLTLETNPRVVAAGENILLVVTSDIAVTGTLTLSLTIRGEADGPFIPAADAGDFVDGLSQTVQANFNGSRTATVMIGTVRDADDIIELYFITLNDGANYKVGDANEVNSDIVVPGTPTLMLQTNPAPVTAGEDITLIVTSDRAIDNPIIIPITIRDRGASGITAGDFTDGLSQSFITDFNGGTTATITIGTVRDADTAAENYEIQVTERVNGSYIAGTQSVLGTINP